MNIKLNISTDQSYNDSFIDTTDNSCENSLGKINLPEPKKDNESSSDEKQSEEENESSSTSEKEEDINVADKEEGTETQSPVPRKIKRRNVELYKNSSD
nr:unnamed protein product [Callosobruchus analis]